VCAPSCGAGQIPICELPNECAAGATCQPTKGKGAQFGTCQ
jgi:hypothetical protein